MAMNLTIVRNTNQETIYHFEATTNESATITLTNLTADTQALTAGGTPRVNIVRFVATGVDGSAMLISRSGGKAIINCAPENAPVLDLTSMGISDGQSNAENIVVASTVASKPVSGYITLRKIQGWDTKVETATYGSYDNVTAVGS